MQLVNYIFLYTIYLPTWWWRRLNIYLRNIQFHICMLDIVFIASMRRRRIHIWRYGKVEYGMKYLQHIICIFVVHNICIQYAQRKNLVL